jgi:hypothetical protein
MISQVKGVGGGGASIWRPGAGAAHKWSNSTTFQLGINCTTCTWRYLLFQLLLFFHFPGITVIVILPLFRYHSYCYSSAFPLVQILLFFPFPGITVIVILPLIRYYSYCYSSPFQYHSYCYSSVFPLLQLLLFFNFNFPGITVVFILPLFRYYIVILPLLPKLIQIHPSLERFRIWLRIHRDIREKKISAVSLTPRRSPSPTDVSSPMGQWHSGDFKPTLRAHIFY